MFKLSINHHIRNLIILVLCLFILFGSQEISLAQPALDEPLPPLPAGVHGPDGSQPTGTSGIDGGPHVGINGAACSYGSIAPAVAAADPGDTLYLTNLVIHEEQIGVIDIDLTLVGANDDCTAIGDTPVVIDANDAPATHGGIVEIRDSASVTFRNLYLRDGTAQFGGLIYAFLGTTVTLDNTDLGYGTASLLGGAIRSYAGTIEMINGSMMYSNVTTGSGAGGAVALADGAELNIHDTSQVGFCYPGYPNLSTTDGAGIYNNGGTINMYDNSGICNNDAVDQGGGIYATGAAVVNVYDNAVIGGSTDDSSNTAAYGAGVYLTWTAAMNVFDQGRIENNSAASMGGGIEVQGNAVLTLDGPAVYVGMNDAVNTGGGIYVGDGIPTNLPSAVIQNGASIVSNTSQYGGGLLLEFDGSSITLDNAQVLTNTANIAGGGFYHLNSSILNIDDSEIRGNQALGTVGGGISADNWVGGTPQVVIRDSRFENNSANQDGGAIHSNGAAINIMDTTDTTAFLDNTAFLGSGGAFYHGGDYTLEMYAMGETYRIQIDGNTAGDDGGGIYTDEGTLDLQGNIHITNNEAQNNGGGLFINGGDHRIRDWTLFYRPWIVFNVANKGDGGGIYLKGVDEDSSSLPGVLLNTVVISGNSAPFMGGSGGGIYADNSNFSLASAFVVENAADGHGGGIAVVNGTTIDVFPHFPPVIPFSAMALGTTICDPSLFPPDFYCSMIHGNIAGDSIDGYGGGVYVDGLSTARIQGVSFGDNQADAGGAVYSHTGGNDVFLLGNIIHHNTGEGVIRMADDGSLFMTNNTVTDNDTTAVVFDDPLGYAEFVNNIIWGNTGGVELNGITINHSSCNDTQSGLPPTISISEDPQFVRVPRGDYRLNWNSPAIDACTAGPPYDIDGVPRPYGADFDMGAFEYVPLNIYLPLTSRD